LDIFVLRVRSARARQPSARIADTPRRTGSARPELALKKWPEAFAETRGCLLATGKEERSLEGDERFRQFLVEEGPRASDVRSNL
jgi:hypothetical protein